jgi:type III restriction enzyme
MTSRKPYRAFDLKDCQDTAVGKLDQASRALLAGSPRTIRYAFKAPTGSGRTVMCAELLQRLEEAEDVSEQLVVVWVSVGELAAQAEAKLRRYALSGYKLLPLSKLRPEALTPNSIVFVDWSDIVEWDENVSMEELWRILDETKQEGRDVICLVDETGKQLKSVKDLALIEKCFTPKLTYEVSSSPVALPSAAELSHGQADYTDVELQDAINDGLLRNETVINAGIGGYASKDSLATDALLDAAFAKQAEIKHAYRKHGVLISPLALVQLPSDTGASTSSADEHGLQELERRLTARGITYANGKLALWLSEEQRNTDTLAAFDSPVDVLLFKQALAVDWECSRAQLLILLQQGSQAKPLRMQTIERILRMPEAKHYPAEVLNKAYLYTDAEEIAVAKDCADSGGYIKHHSMFLKPELATSPWHGLALPNFFQSRVAKQGPLGEEFVGVLKRELDSACEIDRDDAASVKRTAAAKIDITGQLLGTLIAEGHVEDWDEYKRAAFEHTTAAVGNEVLEHAFEKVLRVWSAGYEEEQASALISEGLSRWFKSIGISEQPTVREIVCAGSNRAFFDSVIEDAKATYEKRYAATSLAKDGIPEPPFAFVLPDEDYCGNGYELLRDITKYTHEPCWIPKDQGKIPRPELSFISLLEGSDDVEWWYHNGANQRRYLAIKYYKDGPRSKLSSFYPDFLVLYKDGRLGIYDTKAGITNTAPETTQKSNALLAYLDIQQQAVHGGIINVTTEVKPARFHIYTDPNCTPYRPGNMKWQEFSPATQRGFGSASAKAA